MPRKRTPSVARKPVDYRDKPPCGLPPFPEAPRWMRDLLVRSGYHNKREISDTPNDELQTIEGVGPRNTERIRQVYPYSGHASETMPCPCCRGTGRVVRFTQNNWEVRPHPRPPRRVPDDTWEPPPDGADTDDAE